VSSTGPAPGWTHPDNPSRHAPRSSADQVRSSTVPSHREKQSLPLGTSRRRLRPRAVLVHWRADSRCSERPTVDRAYIFVPVTRTAALPVFGPGRNRDGAGGNGACGWRQYNDSGSGRIRCGFRGCGSRSRSSCAASRTFNATHGISRRGIPAHVPGAPGRPDSDAARATSSPGLRSWRPTTGHRTAGECAPVRRPACSFSRALH
jgi:hypothetical protein